MNEDTEAWRAACSRGSARRWAVGDGYPAADKMGGVQLAALVRFALRT